MRTGVKDRRRSQRSPVEALCSVNAHLLFTATYSNIVTARCNCWILGSYMLTVSHYASQKELSDLSNINMLNTCATKGPDLNRVPVMVHSSC